MKPQIATVLVIAGLLVSMLSPDAMAKPMPTCHPAVRTGVALPDVATRFCRFFRGRTGDPLSIDLELSTVTVIALDLDGYGGGFPSARFLHKYGRFRVLVLHGTTLAKALFGNGAVLPEADTRGIFWVRHRHEWFAFRRYRNGVILDWFSASRRGQIDARWLRLDRILRAWPG